jgi:glycosyltransferase involved in cell wall biosynthesis
MKIAAIVPAFNESHSIKNVVEDLLSVAISHKLQLTVVVVNDCSTDETGKIIDKLHCVALHLPVNLGIGGAMQTGFKYAFENNFDYAIQVDGDGQHPASEIPKIIAASIKNNWDVTIGSRFLSKEGFQSSNMRRAGIKYFSRLNKLLTGFSINDTTSGFRLLNRKVLALVNEYYPDEYPEPEAIVLFSKNKLQVGEVQVQMRERQGGVSSINSVGAVYYMMKVTLASLFTRIRNI